jgi:hypothetical protein
LKDTVTTGNWPWCETVSGDGSISKWTIADRGTGLVWLVEELELEPPDVVVLARAVAGVEDAKVGVADGRAEPLVVAETALLLPVVLANIVAGVVEKDDPEAGVRVDCAPLVATEALPETLWVCVEVPVVAWI